MNYRPEIDGLRTVAILPVVLYHSGVPYLPGGFVGVDIFFVISGFLITSILLNDFREDRYSLLNFYERRARRILPAFFLVMGCTLVAGWLTLPPLTLEELTTSAAAATLFVSNMYFWDAIDYFSSKAEFWPLIHTWSLSVEEQFYVFFPLLLMLLLPRVGLGKTRGFLLLAVVLSLLVGILGSTRSPVATFYWLPTRFWELGLGAWLAMGGLPKPKNRTVRGCLSTVGAIAILVAILAYEESIPFPGWWALLPVVGTVLIIACGGDTRVARSLSLAPIVFIGLISYSLYLWHWPILVFARYAYGTVELPPLVVLVCLVLMVSLAVLSWKFVEAPFRNRDRLTRGSIFTFSACGAVLVLGVAAFSIATSGIPQRLDEQQSTIADSIRDFSGMKRCWNLQPKEGDLSGLCKLGVKDAAETVLFWGDSHASALTPAWEILSRTKGLGGVLATHGSCPPLPKVQNVLPGPVDRSCASYNDVVWRWLQTGDHSIRHVVLMAYWNPYITGTRAEGDVGAPIHLSYDDAPTRNDNVDAVKTSLEVLVTDLVDRGLSVTIVDGMPEIGWNVPATLLFRQRLGIPPPPAPSLEMVQLRSEQSHKIFNEMGMRNGVHFVSITEDLCTPLCKITLEGKPVYSDSNHLSIFGSGDVVAPLLAERMLWQ